MVKTVQGQLDSKGLKIALVVSRFNEFMGGRLLEGALDALRRTGACDDDLLVARVPGGFELPLAADKLAAGGRFDGVICLGVLIRGATPHFDFIAAEAAKGIAQTALKHGIPVSFGVLTADTIEQAIERSGSKGGNKGYDAAMACIEMINLYRGIGQ